jgi:hypothetical protein
MPLGGFFTGTVGISKVYGYGLENFKYHLLSSKWEKDTIFRGSEFIAIMDSFSRP